MNLQCFQRVNPRLNTSTQRPWCIAIATRGSPKGQTGLEVWSVNNMLGLNRRTKTTFSFCLLSLTATRRCLSFCFLASLFLGPIQHGPCMTIMLQGYSVRSEFTHICIYIYIQFVNNWFCSVVFCDLCVACSSWEWGQDLRPQCETGGSFEQSAKGQTSEHVELLNDWPIFTDLRCIQEHSRK